jgi:hypothetical protein
MCVYWDRMQANTICIHAGNYDVCVCVCPSYSIVLLSVVL